MTTRERIEQLAKEKGLNNRKLEQLTGVSNGQISKWDKNLSFSNIEKIAKFLNVSIDWLITGKESEELTAEEQKLINLYRTTDNRGKKNIMRTAEAEADNGEQTDQISTSKIG